MAQSPPASAGLPSKVTMPTHLSARDELPVHLAVARLRPQTLAGDSQSGHATALDIFITFDMSRIVGLSSSSAVPSWLLKLVVWVAVPSIWQSVLQVLAAMKEPSNLHATRISADRSGLYATIARWTRQSPVVQRPTERASQVAGRPPALLTNPPSRSSTEIRRHRWPKRLRRSRTGDGVDQLPRTRVPPRECVGGYQARVGARSSRRSVARPAEGHHLAKDRAL